MKAYMYSCTQGQLQFGNDGQEYMDKRFARNNADGVGEFETFLGVIMIIIFKKKKMFGWHDQNMRNHNCCEDDCWLLTSSQQL